MSTRESWPGEQPDISDVEDEVEEFVCEFRQAVTAVDPTPLADEETEWNRLLGEVLEGVW